MHVFQSFDIQIMPDNIGFFEITKRNSIGMKTFRMISWNGTVFSCKTSEKNVFQMKKG